jgi:formylglycine-generating enzyme required for sulfatase activity
MRPLLLVALVLFFLPQSLQAQDAPREITNSIGMKMLLIPKGTFQMGSPKHQELREADETQHQVILSQDFYLGMHEVTQAQYEKVANRNPSHFQDYRVQGDNSNLPVENVYWEEAVAFCEKLSELPEEKKAGRVYRLPTEAEWEYACRAGTDTVYSFSDKRQDLGQYAWFANNSGSKEIDAEAISNRIRETQDYIDALFSAGCSTHPVGQKKPNAWGLYDMHGNVAEWCLEWYREYPEGTVTDPGLKSIQPAGPKEDWQRVIRGGSWYVLAADCRSAFRRKVSPSLRDQVIGFRVVLNNPQHLQGPKK